MLRMSRECDQVAIRDDSSDTSRSATSARLWLWAGAWSTRQQSSVGIAASRWWSDLWLSSDSISRDSCAVRVAKESPRCVVRIAGKSPWSMNLVRCGLPSTDVLEN